MKTTKILAFLSVLVFSLFLAGSALAHGQEQAQTLDEILREILQRQNVESIRDIRCQDLTDDDFERLGEAVMSYMHPDTQEHEAMDEMMGGEGSESLRSAHIHMGKRFLGCEQGVWGMGRMGMMMMGPVGPMGWGAGSGSVGFWLWQGLMMAFWIGIVAVVVFGAIYLAKKVIK